MEDRRGYPQYRDKHDTGNIRAQRRRYNDDTYDTMEQYDMDEDDTVEPVHDSSAQASTPPSEREARSAAQ